MRAYQHLHAVHADASADPRLHGIARGLGLLLAPPSDDDLPDAFHEALARLKDRDDWDGPDRDEE